MDDESLRRGDAVMTPGGIRIFTGPAGPRHSPEKFVSLADVKGLGTRERAALATLDSRGSSAALPGSKTGLVTGRSAAEPVVTAGTVIADPKGRMIRYVGP